MRRRLLMAFLAVLPIMLVGCTIIPPYRPNVTDYGQGALLRAWSSGDQASLIYTCIEKVDGLLLFDGFHASDVAQFGTGSLVDPGVRTLSVMGTQVSGIFHYTGRVELTATLKPGHIYLLKAKRAGNLITLWIEDQETQEAASDRKTTSTSRWIKVP